MKEIKELFYKINLTYQTLNDLNCEKQYDTFEKTFKEMLKLLAKIAVSINNRAKESNGDNEAYKDYLVAAGLICELYPLGEKINISTVMKYRPHILLMVGVFLVDWLNKFEVEEKP